MKSDGNDLLELGGAIRRGYSSVIANAGKIIAAITLAVAVVITFADVAFCNIGGEQFTTTLIVMLASSYLMYFSLEDSGEREGEESCEFVEAKKNYSDVRQRITPRHIDALRAFCLDYSRRELCYRRLSYIGEMGYSEAELARFRAGEKFPSRARRVFRRAERMRAVRLSPQILLAGPHPGTKSELCDPGYKKILASIYSLIPSTVCMIFTLSFILTAKDGMSGATILEGLIKLSALPIIGFKGLLDGYQYAKEDKSAWLETKARLLCAFIDGDPESDQPPTAEINN